ncbi:MAG: endolytic transglycosylase MltG [Marinobacter sp.]|uniref:endolytic transglycosylase MltG n=1 Tax=Marinobacter sp. TaxID=50741 RepID=UPI00299CF6A1|nr:endolytic transglycosylase MltG [Marinobacter sp.]MDX1633414.1 endolytic transglycosylase MltG [Marinobacter sp.]
MIKSLLIALSCLGVLVLTGSGLWAWQGLQTLTTPQDFDQPVLFEVPAGTAFDRVARQLESEGLTKDSLWLRLHGRLYPDQTRVKAGEYEFTPGMSTLQMLAMMVRGDTKSWSVQFIEGWRFSDMRVALAAHPELEQVTADWTDERIMTELGAEGEHPEGRFFPDTYLFKSSDSDLDILRRAFERMNRVLAEEWAKRDEDLPYDSPYEALIMASIVEKETGAAFERDQVAGVFVRRLRRGMRLQTDPTVIYGMGEAYRGGISRRDLRTPTPYNTYRISGLPPTPIALPGREAIHAALNPGEGEALYFVAKGDGTHKFSKTLEEHQKAVRAYQLQRRSDYRSSPPPESAQP